MFSFSRVSRAGRVEGIFTGMIFKDEGGRMKDEINHRIHPSSLIIYPYEFNA
jgi:hypothetical protein